MLSEFIQEAVQDPKTAAEIDCKIYLSYRTIRFLDKVADRFRHIRFLYLNHNCLDSLSGIEQFPELEELHVKFNYINNFEDIYKISNRFALKVLNVKGNPIEKHTKCNYEYLQSLFFNLTELNDHAYYSSSSSLSSKKKVDIPMLSCRLKDKNSATTTLQFKNNSNQSSALNTIAVTARQSRPQSISFRLNISKTSKKDMIDESYNKDNAYERLATRRNSISKTTIINNQTIDQEIQCNLNESREYNKNNSFLQRQVQGQSQNNQKKSAFQDLKSIVSYQQQTYETKGSRSITTTTPNQKNLNYSISQKVLPKVHTFNCDKENQQNLTNQQHTNQRNVLKEIDDDAPDDVNNIYNTVTKSFYLREPRSTRYVNAQATWEESFNNQQLHTQENKLGPCELQEFKQKDKCQQPKILEIQQQQKQQIQDDNNNVQVTQQQQPTHSQQPSQSSQNNNKMFSLDEDALFASQTLVFAQNILPINNQVTATFAKQQKLIKNTDNSNLFGFTDFSQQQQQQQQQRSNNCNNVNAVNNAIHVDTLSNNNPLDTQIYTDVSFENIPNKNPKLRKELTSLNLSRISQINQKSLTNISIPQLRLDTVLDGANNMSNINILDGVEDKEEEQADQQDMNNTVMIQNRIDQHIENIDQDILKLAILFHQKQLKEKVFASIKIIIAQVKQAQLPSIVPTVNILQQQQFQSSQLQHMQQQYQLPQQQMNGQQQCQPLNFNANNQSKTVILINSNDSTNINNKQQFLLDEDVELQKYRVQQYDQQLQLIQQQQNQQIQQTYQANIQQLQQESNMQVDSQEIQFCTSGDSQFQEQQDKYNSQQIQETGEQDMQSAYNSCNSNNINNDMQGEDNTQLNLISFKQNLSQQQQLQHNNDNSTNNDYAQLVHQNCIQPIPEQSSGEESQDDLIKMDTAQEYCNNFLKIRVFYSWRTFCQNRKTTQQMHYNLSNMKKSLIALSSARDTARSTNRREDSQSISPFEDLKSARSTTIPSARGNGCGNSQINCEELPIRQCDMKKRSNKNLNLPLSSDMYGLNISNNNSNVLKVTDRTDRSSNKA